MSESNPLDSFESHLRSQSLGIATPDVAALMYRCGQAAAREASDNRAALRHWTHLGMVAVVALFSGVALDRATLTRTPQVGPLAPVATNPSSEQHARPAPERDRFSLDPHMLRASSRLPQDWELADAGWNRTSSSQRETSLDAETFAPVPRMLDLRNRLTDPLVP